MKKLFLIVLLFQGFAGNSQVGNICPCGANIFFTVEKINFHRPRTDCQSGFGICLKISPIYFSCMPCGQNTEFTPAEQKGMVNFSVSVECGKAEIHLPLTLGADEEFKEEKMDVFEIEDETLQLSSEKNEQVFWVKGGTYPVYVKNGEYVIPVEIY